MAAPLKDAYGPEIPEAVAGMIARAEPSFPRAAFLRDALEGYGELELMDRGRHMAAALGRHLPADYGRAVAILVASLGPPLGDPDAGGAGMAPFVYLPHVMFVAERGLGHFEASMAAQHAITQRFTCELSIRPFIEAEPGRTLGRLAEWTGDPSPHVRRLVSEGTRPRLPWAPRLRGLMADPAPVLPLLEALRDDPSGYVRRSVANNLNDISKDHPELVVALAGRWLEGAPAERRRLVRHALRTLVRAGDPTALALLGLGDTAGLDVRGLAVSPDPAPIGGDLAAAMTLVNSSERTARALVHLRVDFVTARGGTSRRTFVVGERELAPGEEAPLAAAVSLRRHTTRTPHPGPHRVAAVVNGREAAAVTATVVEPR